jgi:hypothetical protein
MKTIHIKNPVIMGGRLEAEITIDGSTKTAWFSVEPDYAKYLDDEVADAFLVGILPRALRDGYDIKCDAPVSEDLLFNLDTYLIPITAKNSAGKAHFVKIDAKPVVRKSSASGVGTGVSGGVDSSDAIMEVLNQSKKYPSMALTHLAYFIHDRTEIVPGEPLQEFRIKQLMKEIDCVDRIVDALKLPIVRIESNIYNVSGIDESLACTYHAMSNIFALAKLFKVYFAASAFDVADFSMSDSYYSNLEYGDIFIFPMLSISSLRFYIAGITRNRFEKTREIANEPWLFDNMNVCFPLKGEKCGINCTAGKCLRTMWDLEIVGALDNYKNSLPVSEFRNNRKKAISWLCFKNDSFTAETLKQAIAAGIITKSEIAQIKIQRKVKNIASKILCLFIPVRKWRHATRRRFK